MKQKKWHSARPGGMPLFLLSAPILPAFLFLVPAARAQLVLMLIFFFRRHPAPDMAFRFVDVQYYTRPGCKRRIDMGKALGHIFMYGCHKSEHLHQYAGLLIDEGKFSLVQTCPLLFYQ